MSSSPPTLTERRADVEASAVAIEVANAAHEIFAERICALIAESARARRTGIAKR